MAELGIIPSPADPYVELGASPQGTLVRKQILHLNRQFIHPKTGKPITLGEDAWQQMKDNFDNRRVTDYVTFPQANEKNQHVESPESNAGLVTGLEREGDGVFAVIDVRDPEVAQRIADGRLPGASAMLHLDAKDPRSGERCGAALLHVCGTLRPHLLDLAPYEPVAALCGPAWTTLPDGSELPPTLLMLCQSEVDAPILLAETESPPEPDYYGGPDMYEDDFLRSEIDRLSTEALYVSSGRPSRPSYDHVAVQREHEARQQAAGLTAEEITYEDVADAGMRLAGLIGQEFTDVMGAARELAFARDEQTAREPRSVAAGLLELTQKLGRSVDDLRPDGLLELSAAAEVGRLAGDDSSMLALAGSSQGTEIARLTAEHGEMLGLAARGSGTRHPSRSGKLVTTKSRAHGEGEDPADEDQPGKGGEVHRKLRAIIERNPDLLTDGQGRTVPEVNHQSYAPKSPAQREREQQRAEGGHGGRGGRSLEDLSRGSARTRYGR